MRQKVPSLHSGISHANRVPSSFSARPIFLIPWMLITALFLLSGCASPKTMAWNHYEEGMLLVYKGYDAKGDKSDKVEKAFNKAIECNKDIPGARASLATYLAKKGDAAGAMALWTEEAKVHPESQKAMDIVLDKNKSKSEELTPPATSGTEAPEVKEAKPGDKPAAPESKEVKSV